jgi:hypothetical protein
VKQVLIDDSEPTTPYFYNVPCAKASRRKESSIVTMIVTVGGLRRQAVAVA